MGWDRFKDRKPTMTYKLDFESYSRQMMHAAKDEERLKAEILRKHPDAIFFQDEIIIPSKRKDET